MTTHYSSQVCGANKQLFSSMKKLILWLSSTLTRWHVFFFDFWTTFSLFLNFSIVAHSQPKCIKSSINHTEKNRAKSLKYRTKKCCFAGRLWHIRPFLGHFGVTYGSFLGPFLGALWRYLRIILASLWHHFWGCFGAVLTHFEAFWALFWAIFGPFFFEPLLTILGPFHAASTSPRLIALDPADYITLYNPFLRRVYGHVAGF